MPKPASCARTRPPLHLDFLSLVDSLDAAGSDLYSLLTPKQRAVEDDLEFNRIVDGGRQWGKTTWSAVAHARAALPGATSLAIAPTVTKARDLLLPGIEWLNKECNANIEWRAGDKRFLFPNGGMVQLMGMSTVREAEKIRGATPPFITIEECGTYAPALLQFAVESCIPMAQVKWFRRGGRGTTLIGTPSKTERDYWHALCRGEFGHSVHHATVYDNPHIEDPEAYIEYILKKNKWTRTTPQFRREILGEFCSESDSLCYAWDKIIYPDAAAPAAGLTFMGIDLGASKSPSAWVVMRVTREETKEGFKVWVLHVLHSESMMTPTVHDVVAKTYALKKRFGVQRMRGDSAGIGSQTLETMRTKFQGVFVENAPKAGSKLARIWLTSSMFTQGTLRIYEGARSLGDQMLGMPWNEDRDDHHPGYPDHECDASHYCVELVNQWTAEQGPKEPKYGTAEYQRQEMDRYRKEALSRLERRDAELQ